MNIVGKKSDAVMVQFAKPEEYMFGCVLACAPS